MVGDPLLVLHVQCRSIRVNIRDIAIETFTLSIVTGSPFLEKEKEFNPRVVVPDLLQPITI